MPVTGEQVNTVMHTARGLSKDRGEQMTILATAFIVECKSAGISKQAVMDSISRAFDNNHRLVPPQ